MKLYGIKTCDTCRKALKALPDAQFIDVRATPLDRAELQRFLDAFGADLVNTRSTTWRGMTEAERAADPLDQLAAHPTLMKRPVIDNGTLYLGWGKDVQAALT
ncbi:arsenate reductase-like glutaredoxin family protein [Litoreibacter meonggei]|uniref:Arsenate reductase-like glutaredoxin family protein n=1 Tax=Litoreibacter meonggei TaxID=1049199 RepID=A0A497X4S2_9RHOB|nr:ArsC/Spx/MgsR family protein [Litoreibacter meonggei]RLJ60237.1 arsenate reductase-like glutaredoxin family protein [Litoreibacter meonggei]